MSLSAAPRKMVAANVTRSRSRFRTWRVARARRVSRRSCRGPRLHQRDLCWHWRNIVQMHGGGEKQFSSWRSVPGLLAHFLPSTPKMIFLKLIYASSWKQKMSVSELLDKALEVIDVDDDWVICTRVPCELWKDFWTPNILILRKPAELNRFLYPHSTL